MAYNSKYTGAQVEAQLDKVDGKADKTYVDAEVAAAKEYASGELSAVREDLEAADQDLKLYVDEQTLASKDYTDFKTKDKYVKPSSGIPASDLAPDVFLQGEKGDKGDKGDTGATGPQGPQGVSVSSVAQTTTSTADGGTNVVTVTLSNGTKSTFNVKNGSKGSNGTNGTNGATFTPSVDTEGNLSWTNDKGLANPATVNIKGPKGDAGEGGAGGDSSLFITHFTVDEFASGRVQFTDEQVEEIRDAARQNKIIALPTSSYDGHAGFLVSSCRYYEGEYDNWNIELTIIHNGASYDNSMNKGYPAFTPSKLTTSPFKPLIEYVSVDEDGLAVADSFNKDNLIVCVEGECRFLQICEIGFKYGMVIRFLTGEDCTIDYWGIWANGVIPTIEPYTAYEMSIVYGADSTPCAVLTPFKYVE